MHSELSCKVACDIVLKLQMKIVKHTMIYKRRELAIILVVTMGIIPTHSAPAVVDSDAGGTRHMLKRQAPGDGNVRCFTSPVCGGDSNFMATARDCCLGSTTALAYQLENGATGVCQQCIVIGWVDGPSFSHPEQATSISLEVNYLKGLGASVTDFDVAVSGMDQTADSGDYILLESQVQLDDGLDDRQVQIVFVVDALALEPDETLKLVLTPRQNFANSNEFLVDTIELIIEDSDDLQVLFTELDYRISMEDNQLLTITVERRQATAVGFTLRITPFNVTQIRDRNTSLPSGLVELLPTRPERVASSEPESDRDFDISVIEVHFEPGDSPRQDITFDAVIVADKKNEEDERFVLVMEVVEPDAAERVDISERNACVCIIIDDDPILLSWEFPEYRITENASIETIDQLFRIRLIKDFNSTTQLLIRIAVFPLVVADSGFPVAQGRGVDYDIGAGQSNDIIVQIQPDESFINVRLRINNEDNIFEGTEVFGLGIANVVNSFRFTNGRYPNTIIYIQDINRVRIGFVETEITVDESSGMALLNVSVLEGRTAVPINVTFCTVNDSATAPDDYTETVTHLVFSEQTTSILVSVPIVDDSIAELTESFQASLKLVDQDSPSNIIIGPDTATITILDDDGDVTTVNDTVIGDPLLTVPIRITNLEELGLQQNLSLCYEVHGKSDAYFNLVSDICTSVNAHYRGVKSFNVIDEIAVTAVDEVGKCRNILIQEDNGLCQAFIDGSEVSGSFSSGGIAIRTYSNRVRISVPNCARLNLVMWVLCQSRSLVTYGDKGEQVKIDASMIKFIITRGFNLLETSHGIVGQFWNIPVTLELYNGIVFQDSPDETFYIVTVSHPESPVRQFPAFYWPRTWEVTKQATDPCLYAGSMQAGGTSEIKEFEDSVIQGQYLDYKLSGPFETEYVYSKFDRMRCSN